jgi:hypothetical protein
MSNFSKSIGGSYGSGPITKHSVSIGQATGSAVNGSYYHGGATAAPDTPPQDGPHGSAPARIAPKAAASGPKNPPNKNTFTRNDGKPALKPSKTAR